MGFADSIREFLDRFKKKEEEEPVEDWGSVEAEEEPAIEEKVSVPFGERFSGMFSWRWRVFSALAKVNVVLNIALVILLYSDTWYLNVLLFLFFTPNTVMILHYLRLLGKEKAEST